MKYQIIEIDNDDILLEIQDGFINTRTILK